jgi:hypothetical protein
MGCLAGCGCALAGARAGWPQEEKTETVKPPEQQPQEPIDKTKWDISVCGINCARCKLLEQRKCGGCRGPLDRHWSANCKMLACAQAKRHEYCFECAEFPCKTLLAFAADGYEHHRLTVENMKRMKELGLRNWIAQQPKPMFCPGWKF